MTYAQNSLQEKSKIYYEQPDVYDVFCQAEDYENKIYDCLLPYIKGKTVLDLGCGTGKYVRLFAPHAQKITGLDASSRQLSLAERACNGLQNVSFICADAAEVSLPAESYDIVLACWMLGTVLDISKRTAVIDNIRRALSHQGGFLLVENASSGEFEELRGKIQTSTDYCRWLEYEAGFKLIHNIQTRFHFENHAMAQKVFETIWGKPVSKRIKSGEINHNVLIFKG